MVPEILRVENISFAHHALTLTIAAGEAVVIEVESDAAVEQLQRLLTGLTPLDRGRILLCGEEPVTHSAKRLARLRSRVGVVPIHGGLLSNLDLWENLILPLDYHHSPTPDRLRAAAEEALQLVGYAGGVHVKVNTLSPFERRQVMMARAFLVEPQLYLYAASNAGLHLREREAIQEILASIQGRAPEMAFCSITAEAGFGGRLSALRRIELLAGDN